MFGLDRTNTSRFRVDRTIFPGKPILGFDTGQILGLTTHCSALTKQIGPFDHTLASQTEQRHTLAFKPNKQE